MNALGDQSGGSRAATAADQVAEPGQDRRHLHRAMGGVAGEFRNPGIASALEPSRAAGERGLPQEHGSRDRA